MPNEMMGVDIMLGNDDITYTSKNDIRVNTFNENLAQAVRNRLLTPVGFFEKYPDYGSYLHRVLGMPRIPSTLVYAKQVVYESLLQEPRIDVIEKIDCKFVGNEIMQIFIRVIPIEEINQYNIVFDYFLNAGE